MSAVTAAVESLITAADLDPAEVNFVRIDTRRGTVQFVGRRGIHRVTLDPPKPAKKTAPAKKTTAAKRPAKKTAAKKAAKKSS